MACLGWDDLLPLDQRAARGCHRRRRRRRRPRRVTAVAALAQRLAPRWTATSPTNIMSVNTVYRR